MPLARCRDPLAPHPPYSSLAFAPVPPSHPRRTVLLRVASPASPPPSPAFGGVLKHRYSDFIVQEVTYDGSLVRLTSFDLPDECMDVKEVEKAAPSADTDHLQALESFHTLCGDAVCDALRGLLERVSVGGGSDVSSVILSADADKAYRSEVHNFFKKNFKFFVTDTVEHNDGVQKCIRVLLGLGSGGGRGGSDWRDDRPFDSRGSTNWPDHIGKFLR